MRREVGEEGGMPLIGWGTLRCFPALLGTEG